jgi:hypothetical protein
MAPARAGTTVRVAPGVATAGNVKAPRGTGYVSNTGQQRWESAQSQLLTFSSGALRPAPGLDPALQAHATTVDARGRQVVYGFLLLRIRPDESLERTLAGLGVALLGPHDDAHKARLPIWPSSPWICSWPFRPSRCSRYSWRAVPDPAKPTGWCEQRDGDPAATPPPGREPREREAPTWPGSTSAS